MSRLNFAVCLGAFMLLGAAHAQAARAENPVRLVYAPMTTLDERSKKLAEEMDKALLTELNDRKRLTVVEREAPASAGDNYMGVAAVHAAWVHDADKAITQGKNDQAVALLQRYLRDVTNKPETANLSELGRAYLLLSVAHFRRGKEDDGHDALDELVRLRPDVEVPASAYPPLFVRLHQKATARWKDKSDATLVIEAPDNAVITLNGRAVPVGTITEVPAGFHYVALSAGIKQIVRKIEVLSGEVKQVQFGALAPKGALSGNRFDTATKRALAGVADRQGAPFIVTAVGAVMGNELVMKVLFVNSAGEGGSLGDFSVDLDMLSASVEASKIADRVLTALDRPPTDIEIAPLLSTAQVTGQMQTLSFFAAATEAVSIAPTANKPAVTVAEPKPETAPKVLVVPQIEPREDPPATGFRPITVVPGETPSATVTSSKPKPVYKQWWLWTLIGVAVAGGLVPVIIYVTAPVGNVAVNADWR
ncbi:MAG: hypothetical protein IT381_17090 [Deltaproteobacteria bacterium]|nr:hypothetical protein [Deltaproteobacteria bacterium]